MSDIAAAPGKIVEGAKSVLTWRNAGFALGAVFVGNVIFGLIEHVSGTHPVEATVAALAGFIPGRA